MNVEEQKKQLRKKIRQNVEALSKSYCDRADAEIFQNVVSLSEYRTAEVIFCYVGTRREVNTLPILNHALAAGKRVCVPKCISKGLMEAYEIHGEGDLETGQYGIYEPKSTCVRIPPENIHLAIVPCMTCSMDGSRLGYGGGYYDRYLTGTDFPKIILCREALAEEEIPTDNHDIRMDVVITENRIIYL